MTVCEISNIFYIYLLMNYIFILIFGYIGLRFTNKDASGIFLFQCIAIMVLLALSTLFLNISGVVS